MHSRFSRWRALSFPQWRLLAEATLFVTGGALAVACLPFKRVKRLASGGVAQPGPPLDPTLAREIRWAVEAVARRMPFRAKCFECGLAAQWMLQRRGYAPTMFYGATQVNKALSAHVWVRNGDVDVVGCDNAADYALLARFPPAQTSLPPSIR